MIRLKKLKKSYGDIIAVNNVSLEIVENEIFGVIGLSGAGKSTLVRLINRLEEPDSGEVYIDNRNITDLNSKDLNDIRKNIGMIFQNFNLLNSRNVKNNISYPLEISKWGKKSVEDRVLELLNLVGLEDKLLSQISELSGGQKQRVAIARALAAGPKILLCDEATSALDPQTTKSILNLIKDIKNKYGLTVVMITHQMEVIKETCHRVALMEKGEIIELGRVEDVFTNPKSDLAKEFVSHLRHDVSDYMNLFKYKKKRNAELVKIHFNKESADKPLIYELIKEGEVVVNILSGDIISLTSTSIGELIVELNGTTTQRESAINLIQSKGAYVEVLNV